jgi:hypothetical protein
MNTKIKFLEIVLSDLISQRDTYELELNRILNKEKNFLLKKNDFDSVLSDITVTNSKIRMLSEYLGTLGTLGTLGNLEDKTENNNNV